MQAVTPTPSVPHPRPPRSAATLLVVRPSPLGPQVLMLLRANKGDHNSGAWVFPGGLVDRDDRDCHPCCAGLDDAQASRQLGVATGGLDFYIAAIRESFEEAGLLFATDSDGAMVTLDRADAAELSALRQPLGRGDVDFADVCRDHGLRLAPDQLHYIAHWITPVGLPKRFDTRFFLALLPPAQDATHDAVETLDHGWFRPADMLADAGSRKMLFVTQTMLRRVAAFDDTESLLQWAQSPGEIKTIVPRRCRDAEGPRTVRPGHPAWPEIGLLDPEGAGTAWCEPQPGVAVRLSPLVHRLTHAGGNSYLVGDDDHGWALIDPPPASERAALDALTGGREPVLLSTGNVSGPSGGWKESQLALQVVATPEGTAWLLPSDKLLFTGSWMPTVDQAAPWLPADADWLAPASGFLLPAR